MRNVIRDSGTAGLEVLGVPRSHLRGHDCIMSRLGGTESPTLALEGLEEVVSGLGGRLQGQ